MAKRRLSYWVTDLIKEKKFKQFLSDKFASLYYTKTSDKANHNSDKYQTVSPSLLGNLSESFIRVKFSIFDKETEIEIYQDIEDSINRYELFYRKAIERGLTMMNRYHEHPDNWVIYGDDEYDLVIDSLDCADFLGQYYFKELIGTSLTRKEKKLHQLPYIEEKCYRLVKAGDYYGNIITKLTRFKTAFTQLLLDKDFGVFLELDNLYNLIVFTHVSVNHSWLKISKNKQNIGNYDIEEVLKIANLFSNLPSIDYSLNVIYKPSLQIKSRTNKYDINIIATADFIYDDKIFEIKSSAKITKNDFYQVLTYYVLSKHKDNMMAYGNLVGAEIVYVKNDFVAEYYFDEILNEKMVALIQDELINCVVRKHETSPSFKILERIDKMKQKK